MRVRMWPLSLAAAGLILTGCRASHPSTTSMPGMSMTPGQTMPSTAAQMICSADIKAKVQQVLRLPTAPTTHTTFIDRRFTCTYDLPMGPLVLSVQDTATKAAAGAHFTNLRTTLGTTDALIGLGERAYGTRTGTVVVLKDSQTLSVDATRLPPVFGSQGQKRTDLAYEIASDVLGCWTDG